MADVETQSRKESPHSMRHEAYLTFYYIAKWCDYKKKKIQRVILPSYKARTPNSVTQIDPLDSSVLRKTQQEGSTRALPGVQGSRLQLASALLLLSTTMVSVPSSTPSEVRIRIILRRATLSSNRAETLCGQVPSAVRRVNQILFGARLAGGCELPSVGARNLTPVLCKGHTCS